MSNVKPHENDDKTLRSYVIGFLLSLVFTIVPYYLVVSGIMKFTSLLIAILSFALVQLIVQVVFFLHLGRGPKARWNLYFLIATVNIVLVVVVGSIVIIHNLHYNIAPADQTKRLVDSEGIYKVGGRLTGACQGTHTNHQIIIASGVNKPLLTVAERCDTLTFINNDPTNSTIAFGTRDHTAVYAGLTDLSVAKGRTKTITLSEVGNFQFHDHSRPEIGGSFAVVNDKQVDGYKN